MVFEVRLIKDEDVLHRRIPPNYFKTNGTISSSAYKVNGRPDVEISVDLAYLTTIETTLADRPNFGIGSRSARDPRTYLARGLPTHIGTWTWRPSPLVRTTRGIMDVSC